MKTHTGGCHCGAVRYEATCDLDSVMDCNCSHCSKKGFLLKFLPKSMFKITHGSEEAMSEYRFNKKHISHRFCPTCGIQTHGSATGPDGTEMVALNVRTLDEELPASVEVKKVDGKSW